MQRLTVEGLSAGYGGRSVLSGVSFRLEEGDICAMIGPNGAGKSTLLRAILDLGTLLSGVVEIAGRDSRRLSRPEMARLASFLPQEYNHGSRLTVLETVLLGRHPHRQPWSGDSDTDLGIAEECMELTGVAGLAGRPFCELSGGERRLVMLASALAQKPVLLLLDEPAASLDFRHQIEVWKLLGRLGAMGVSILASTHEIGIASRFATHMLAVADGGARAFGSPPSVCTGGILRDVFGVDLAVSQDGFGGFSVVPLLGGGE